MNAHVSLKKRPFIKEIMSQMWGVRVVLKILLKSDNQPFQICILSAKLSFPEKLARIVFGWRVWWYDSSAVGRWRRRRREAARYLAGLASGLSAHTAGISVVKCGCAVWWARVSWCFVQISGISDSVENFFYLKWIWPEPVFVWKKSSFNILPGQTLLGK